MRTELLGERLRALDLLEPVQARLTRPSGRAMNLAGFSAVSREKLAKLSDAQLGELVRGNVFKVIYWPLHAMHNLSLLAGWRGEADAAHDKAAEHDPLAGDEFSASAPNRTIM